MRLRKVEKNQSDPQPLFHLYALAYIKAKSGNKNGAKMLLQQPLQHPRHESVDPAILAYIYFALGETDQGFAWLEKGYASTKSGLTALKVGAM